MSLLTFIEKQTICRLFGISDGFIFKYWSQKGEYNKNKTKDLILDSCGINIYEDKKYKTLSQQKCIEKIWNEAPPKTVAKLLQALCDYFSFYMGDSWWSDEDSYDYRQVKEIIDRLNSLESIALPTDDNSQNLKLLLDDIAQNINNGTPEMAIDRLHTYSSEFIRKVCDSHGIKTTNDKGEHYSLESIVGMLKKWYTDNNYFDSEFCPIAIGCSISIFSKFNELRNKRSAAHPNDLLAKAEAEYSIRMISDTLLFIDKIEKSKSVVTPTNPWDEIVVSSENLPF